MNGSWTPPDPPEDTDKEGIAEVEKMTLFREVFLSDLPEREDESSREDNPSYVPSNSW